MVYLISNSVVFVVDFADCFDLHLDLWSLEGAQLEIWFDLIVLRIDKFKVKVIHYQR